MRVARRTLSALLGASLLIGAGCGPDPSTEARSLLDRLDGLDLDAPMDERRRRVTSLANMPLHDASVKQARDVCVEAHRSILEAEELHANASAALARFEDEGAIPVGTRGSIQRDIEGSNAALARARDVMGRCERHTRDLDVRYRRRRR